MLQSPSALMTTGAFSWNVGKLFSELLLVADNLLLHSCRSQLRSHWKKKRNVVAVDLKLGMQGYEAAFYLRYYTIHIAMYLFDRTNGCTNAWYTMNRGCHLLNGKSQSCFKWLDFGWCRWKATGNKPYCTVCVLLLAIDHEPLSGLLLQCSTMKLNFLSVLYAWNNGILLAVFCWGYC